MLFTYTYVSHPMEKMQEFIDFIFHEVWCKAPISLVFHTNLFEGNPELMAIMVEFGFSPGAAKAGKAFYKEVKIIYEFFVFLSQQEIDQFKQWYQGNNDIENVCANDPAIHLARYIDIAANHGALVDDLGKFFKNLYSRVNLAALRSEVGDINDHYKIFVQTNKTGKCPFCGINDLLGEHHSKREAYDHYLPKALYPFNSINFRNLVPACHHCNSSYKTSKDPTYTPKDPARSVQRRAIFYPYKTEEHSIELKVELRHSNIDTLVPADIRLQFGPDVIADKIDTWKDVYGIEERYKAKLCGDNDGKYWLMQVLEEGLAYDKKPAEILAMCSQLALSRPYADCNFLRKPFLDACQKIGILN